jgi:hypothetical protein
MKSEANRRRSRSRGLIFSLFATTLLATPPDAAAGTIGFRVTASVTTGPGVVVKVELTNTGDEAAHAVAPTVLVGDRSATGEPISRLSPGQPKQWTLDVQSEDLDSGSYVAVTRVAYEDANGYPFEVLASTPFDVSARRRPAAGGSLVLPAVALRKSVSGTFRLKAAEGRTRDYAIRVVAPRGLRVVRHDQVARVDEAGHADVPIEIRNDGLLAGNSTAVFLLVTGLNETPSQTDLVRATVRAGTAADRVDTNDFISVFAVLAILLIVLELLGRGQQRPPSDERPLYASLAGLVLAFATSAFLVIHYPWDDLLSKTVTAGGDMASLYYPTKLLAEEILPRGEITGWTMGNYAGFPVLHFYSTLPFVLIALLGHVAPMTVVFKLVTLLGPTLLPLSAALMFRMLGYGPGAPAIAAGTLIPFLLQQGNSMWGGNIPSVLAGEFCHSIGLALSLIFIAQLHRIDRGRGSWPLAALMLAVIGLCHTFAFFAAAWFSLFYLRPRHGLASKAGPLLSVYGLAFLLLCVWGLPLPSRLVFTSEWSMIWNIRDWKEVLPQPLWPAAILAGLNCLVTVVGVKRSAIDQMGMLLFNAAGGILLYYVVPALGFPDIRFIPVAQVFVSLLAADFLVWCGSRLSHPRLYAACFVAVALAWGHSHLGYIPAWLKWNYSGYEGKPTWQLFKSINDHIAGDLNDPRVMFEHSEIHNRFGSSRAFENIPLFSGRATLEGVFHQASQSSPFIFYLQSEASEKTSGPFPQYTYTRLNPEKALPHLRLFNVGELVVVTDKAKAAYDAHPEFERTFTNGAYAVYRVKDLDPRYVVPAAHTPVLYEGSDWKLAFYRWYRHPELLDIPLVPAALLGDHDARQMGLRTDTIERLPKEPILGDCEVSSRLENYRITFHTACPDRPHIVKVSYFPRWTAGDTARIVPVSPGYMLVYPNRADVEIKYARLPIDWIGVVMTGSGLLLLAATLMSPGVRAAIPTRLARVAGPLLLSMERHRIIVSLALLSVMIFIGAYTRYSLRVPDRSYERAHEAYRAREFDEAIKRLEDWTRIDKDTFKQATALHQLGISYNETGQFAAAVEVLERLRFQFPNVDYGAATLFHLAKAWEALGDTARARDYAVLLSAGHPGSPMEKRLRREAPTLFDDAVEG